jgi:hypothetical protein
MMPDAPHRWAAVEGRKLMARISRFRTLAVVAGAAMLLPSTALAAPQRPSISTMAPLHGAGMQTVMKGLRAVTVRASTGVLAQRLHPRDVSSAASLQIPWTDWPAGSTQEAGNVVDTTKLDDAGYNPFANFHTTTYVSAGVEGGYIQGAQVSVAMTSGTAATGDAFWLGTYYPTATAAAARVTDAVNFFSAKSIPAQACDIPELPTCEIIAFTGTVPATATTPATTFVNFLTIFALDNVVGENLVTVDQTTYNDKTAQAAVGTIAGTLIGAGAGAILNGGTPTGPASVSVGQVIIAHLVNGKLKNSRSVKSGEAAYFLVSFTTQNGGTQVPTGTIAITKGSKRIASGPLQTVNVGTAAAPVVVLGAKATLKNTTKKTEKLTVQVLLTLGTSTDAGTATFSLKPKT